MTTFILLALKVVLLLTIVVSEAERDSPSPHQTGSTTFLPLRQTRQSIDDEVPGSSVPISVQVPAGYDVSFATYTSNEEECFTCVNGVLEHCNATVELFANRSSLSLPVVTFQYVAVQDGQEAAFSFVTDGSQAQALVLRSVNVTSSIPWKLFVVLTRLPGEKETSIATRVRYIQRRDTMLLSWFNWPEQGAAELQAGNACVGDETYSRIINSTYLFYEVSTELPSLAGYPALPDTIVPGSVYFGLGRVQYQCALLGNVSKWVPVSTAYQLFPEIGPSDAVGNFEERANRSLWEIDDSTIIGTVESSALERSSSEWKLYSVQNSRKGPPLIRPSPVLTNCLLASPRSDAPPSSSCALTDLGASYTSLQVAQFWFLVRPLCPIDCSKQGQCVFDPEVASTVCSCTTPFVGPSCDLVSGLGGVKSVNRLARTIFIGDQIRITYPANSFDTKGFVGGVLIDEDTVGVVDPRDPSTFPPPDERAILNLGFVLEAWTEHNVKVTKSQKRVLAEFSLRDSQIPSGRGYFALRYFDNQRGWLNVNNVSDCSTFVSFRSRVLSVGMCNIFGQFQLFVSGEPDPFPLPNLTLAPVESANISDSNDTFQSESMGVQTMPSQLLLCFLLVFMPLRIVLLGVNF